MRNSVLNYTTFDLKKNNLGNDELPKLSWKFIGHIGRGAY